MLVNGLSLPFKFMYNEKIFGKVGEQKSRFLHEKSFFFIQVFFSTRVCPGAIVSGRFQTLWISSEKTAVKKLYNPPPHAVSQTTTLIILYEQANRKNLKLFKKRFKDPVHYAGIKDLVGIRSSYLTAP